MSILTVGTVAFDSIHTPFGSALKVIGGACTYISWAASYYHKNINLVSIVGNDFPDEELDLLRQRGVNTDGLEVVKNGKTFFWEGRYHDNMIGRDTMVTDLNVLDDFNPVLPETYKNSKFIMLGNLTPQIQIQVLDQLKDPQFVILDTMDFWMDVAREDLLSAISRVQMVTINDEEARQLSGKYFLVDAARAIHEMGPEYLVIKKGEHGAMLFHKNRIFALPALPLSRIKDPTGAGDTFAGGLIGYLAKTEDLSFENMKRAIVHGSTMASFCVEEFSLEKIKNLDPKLIEDRLEQFKRLTDFELV